MRITLKVTHKNHTLLGLSIAIFNSCTSKCFVFCAFIGDHLHLRCNSSSIPYNYTV